VRSHLRAVAASLLLVGPMILTFVAACLGALAWILWAGLFAGWSSAERLMDAIIAWGSGE